MKEATRQLFARALDAIEAAEILATNGKIDFAAGRAYYAMFYVAEALLNEKGFQFGNMETSLPRMVSILRRQRN
jgi:HEPN domain.